MLTKSVTIRKNTLKLPGSWKDGKAFISISGDSILIKRTKPLNLEAIREKLETAGKNISYSDMQKANNAPHRN
jgi:hypothetical protein